MRKLTIKREKSGSAGLVSMNVFIEDQDNGEFKIGNTPCLRLGSVDNGEEKTFEISESTGKLFVVGTPTKKSSYLESYPLPEGSDAVFISGKNHFCFGSGNPFYFNNHPDPDIAKKRKKSSSSGFLITLCSILVVLAILYLPSIIKGTAKPEDFTHNGLTITLTNHFKNKGTTNEGALHLSHSQVDVYISQDKFEDISDMKDLTVAEFAKKISDSVDYNTVSDIKANDKYAQFECIKKKLLNSQSIYFAVFKSGDSFWTVQFTCSSNDIENFQEQFGKWADSVSFN